MITMRHGHNMLFGNSDIYVVVLLRATSDKITKSEAEIQACKWMHIDQFLEDPQVHDFNRFIVQQYLELKARKIKMSLDKTLLKIGNFSREITSLVLEDES